MVYRISIYEAIINSGISFGELVIDSVVPSCCSEGCMVEPDGVCVHGYNSILIGLM